MPEDIFNAEETPEETPEEISEETPAVETPEEKTVDELLELSDEELKKHGIDDPHNWKSYQKLLHKKEQEWREDKKRLEEKLSETETQFERFQRELSELKNPAPKNEPPQKPVKPIDFDPVDMFDPSTPSGKWYIEDQQYREAKEAYRDRQLQALMGEIQAEKQVKQQQKEAELKKAETIKAFQEYLDPEDSVALYNKLEQALTAPIKDGAKIFAELFKKEPKKKSKKLDVIPPGMDGAGSIPADDESKDFMKGLGTIKNKDIFETK